MHRGTDKLRCEICGRPYHPGERIEIVRLEGSPSVVHVNCRPRTEIAEAQRGRSDRDFASVRQLIDSAVRS